MWVRYIPNVNNAWHVEGANDSGQGSCGGWVGRPRYNRDASGKSLVQVDFVPDGFAPICTKCLVKLLHAEDWQIKEGAA